MISVKCTDEVSCQQTELLLSSAAGCSTDWCGWVELVVRDGDTGCREVEMINIDNTILTSII